MFTQKNRLFLNEKKSFSFIISFNIYICVQRYNMKTKKPQTLHSICGFLFPFPTYLCFHAIVFVRNSQFLTSFSTTCSQYSATVSGSHSFAESVFVSSLSVRGLECSFHFRIYYLCYYLMVRAAKLQTFFK